MASWANKLEKRLSGLTDSASRESIQALAKWLGFNRKHGPHFATAFATALDTAGTPTRQWLLLQILHEALILDNETPAKWDRLSELRKCFGEQTIVVVVEKLGRDAATRKKIEALVKQWDELNVFGGPTLVAQIRRLLAAAAQEPKVVETSNDAAVTKSAEVETPAPSPPKPSPQNEKAEEPKSEEPKKVEQESEEKKGDEKKGEEKVDEKVEKLKSEEAAPVIEEKKELTTDDKPAEKEEEPKPSEEATTKLSKDKSAVEETKNIQQTIKAKDATYDFESKGIPPGKVDAHDFLDPCKAITALQISRDLSNDAAVQLSSLLSSIPDDLKAVCEDAENHVNSTGEAFELPEDKARSFSIRTSEELLDKNLDEALEGIKNFLGIIHKQREARGRLIHLLVRSRCEFGANDAAESFHNLDETMAQLQKRKQTLKDAMDLEFIDFEETQPKASAKTENLEPLSWYKKSERESKRARTD